MNKISVTLETLPERSNLESIWRSLSVRADHSVFQSWPWVRCWLDTPGVAPALLIARDGDTVMGLALIQQSVQHRRFMQIPTSHLQETGDPEVDSLYIEYNNFVVDRACRDAVTSAFLEFLTGPSCNWRELHLSGVSETFKRLAERTTPDYRIQRKLKSYYVDLDALRIQGRSFLDVLSRNTRQHHNNSLRHIKDCGELHLHRAENVAEALTYLENLKHLHQHSWRTRGQPGAFSNSTFESFHQRLIEGAFSDGIVDILQIQAGDTRLGYLLNFVYEGTVYQYQSGFDYSNSRHRPGYIAHAAAIQYYLDTRMRIYNFMVGDNQQKSSFSTNTEPLFWLTLQRPSFGMRLENIARSLRHDRRKI